MKTTLKHFTSAAICGLLGAGSVLLTSTSAMGQSVKPFLPPPPPVVSTIPSNGDVNPYGVAFVPRNIATGGALQSGDILVSNFNNSANLQGTGTTITRVDETGKTSTFFKGQPGLGLTAALGVVRAGFVFVGNLPTSDGTSATVKPGSLIVLNRNGQLVGQLINTNIINGPWGMAIHDEGNGAQVFVSNVLAGTVIRLDISFSSDGNSVDVRNAVLVGSGFAHRLDPAALVLGPSGLFYDVRTDTLFIAESADNTIYAIHEAGSSTENQGRGNIVYQDNAHLHGPLDLIMAPNGHLLVANSDGFNADPNQPSEIVEFTVGGKFVSQFSIDPANGGAFGIGVSTPGGGLITRFAAVDDNANTLSIFAEQIN